MMDKRLENLPKLAQEKFLEHQKSFKKLSRKQIRGLDGLIHRLHDEVFREVDCLTCANCCKTTSPIVTDRDITRIAKYLRLKESKFIAQYLFRDTDGYWAMKQTPCPFLDSSNYCLIYSCRPKACAEYPHTNRKKFYQIKKLTLKNAEICPAVFEILERFKTEMK